MKNKTKKILAGICLGFVGMGCFTGCTMSDEQKSALDLVTQKSDEIIELLEENMKLNNSRLSKEVAVEKILLARNAFSNPNIQLKVDSVNAHYDGYYDKVNHIDISEMYMFRDENTLKFVTKDTEKIESSKTYMKYEKMDFENDTYYSYHEVDDDKEFNLLQYSETTSLNLMNSLDLLGSFGFEVITTEMLVDLTAIDNQYEFTLLNYKKSDDSATRYQLRMTINDNKITNVNAERVYLYSEESEVNWLTRDGDGNFIEPAEEVFRAMRLSTNTRCDVETLVCSYQYNNIDFGSINQKFAEIDAEHLTNQ